MEVEEETKRLPWPWVPTRRLRTVNDPFFDDGNLECSLGYKQIKGVYLSDEDDDDYSDEGEEKHSEKFPCQIGVCQKSFTDRGSYEAHYNSTHRNVCVTCSKVLPTAHLLEIHVLENHDSLFDLMAHKQNMYQCLVESCTEKFPNASSRKEHLLKVHRYPSSFRFERPKKPAAQRRKAKKADGKDSAMDVDVTSDNNHDGAIATEPMHTDPQTSARKFSHKVPKNISFGKGIPRTFQPRRNKKKHWHQTEDTAEIETEVNIEEVQMKDLADALEDA